MRKSELLILIKCPFILRISKIAFERNVLIFYLPHMLVGQRQWLPCVYNRCFCHIVFTNPFKMGARCEVLRP